LTTSRKQIDITRFYIDKSVGIEIQQIGSVDINLLKFQRDELANIVDSDNEDWTDGLLQLLDAMIDAYYTE
jgi:hypothetical protein